MSKPFTSYHDPIRGAIEEIISGISALNMNPAPIEKPEGSTYLSQTDMWVKHSLEHFREAIEQLKKASAGVPYTEEIILDAPNGRACAECEAAWMEYRNAADDLARLGRTGAIGDTLPPNMSAKAVELINEDPEAFQQEVRRCAYARAMKKSEENSYDLQQIVCFAYHTRTTRSDV